MSGRGMDFIEGWMANHVLPGGDATQLASDALAAAQVEGITPSQIEEETGPLKIWIAESINHAPGNDLEDIVTDADD